MLAALALLLATGEPVPQAAPPKIVVEKTFLAATPRQRIAILLAAIPAETKRLTRPVTRNEIDHVVAGPYPSYYSWRPQLLGKPVAVATDNVCERRSIAVDLMPDPRHVRDPLAPVGKGLEPLIVVDVHDRMQYARPPSKAGTACPTEAAARYVDAPDRKSAVTVFDASDLIMAGLERGVLPFAFGCSEPGMWRRCLDAPARLRDLLASEYFISRAPRSDRRPQWSGYTITQGEWYADINFYEGRLVAVDLFWRIPPVV